MSLHFQLELNTLGILSVPTGENQGCLLLNVIFQLN
jgi:hypothetical protein